MARNKLVDMIGKLSEEQVERLSGIAMEYLDLNTEVEDTAPQKLPLLWGGQRPLYQAWILRAEAAVSVQKLRQEIYLRCR